MSEDKYDKICELADSIADESKACIVIATRDGEKCKMVIRGKGKCLLALAATLRNRLKETFGYGLYEKLDDPYFLLELLTKEQD